MASVLHEVEPISPELVLVASPDEALRARASLPPPPTWTVERRAADSRPAPAAPSPPPAPRRRRRRRWPVAVAVVVLAGVVLVWVGRPRPLRPSFAAEPPAPRPAARLAPAPAVPVRSAPAPAPGPQPQPQPVPKQPPAFAGFVPARIWIWQPAPQATRYLFELSLGGKVVVRQQTAQARLELPRSFRFHAGTYRWTVRPVSAVSTAPLTDSRFTVTPAAAALANR